MKLLTFPIRLLLRLVLLPIKLVLATAGLTFRAGFKAGTLPVKGSALAVRKLGFKAVLLFAAGVAVGVLIGRRLGEPALELAETSYPGDFGSESSLREVPSVVDAAAVAAADAAEEAEAELEAVVDQVLGQTGGELGVDSGDEDTVGGADV